MPNETLEDLMRQVGLNAPVRPAAWERTREARPGYQQQQSPAGALADPRTVPYRRVPTRRDREFSRASLADTTQRGAYSEPRNQFAEAGMNVLETTGAPSFARGVRSIQANEPGRAAGEFAMGGLGLLGTASLPFGGGARPPPRIPRIQQAIPEAQGIPNAPPRLPGRATDGSVLPIRPREPFRNSLRGGSDDLREAARPTASPDAGSAPSGRTVESLDRLPQRVRTQLDGAREWARRQPRGGTASGLDDEQAFHSYIDLTQADIDAGVHHQIVRALGRMTNFEWGVALNGNRAQLTSNASPFWTPTFHRQMRPEGIEEFTHYHTTNAPLSPGDLAAADQYQRMSAVSRNGRIDMRWPEDVFGAGPPRTPNAAPDAGQWRVERVRMDDLRFPAQDGQRQLAGPWREGDPILVGREADGSLVVYDGNHRARLAQAEGVGEVNAVIRPADELRDLWANGTTADGFGGSRVFQERMQRATRAPDGGASGAGQNAGVTIRTNPERDHVLEAVDNEGRVVGFLDVELSRNGQYAPGSGPYARAVHVNERSRRQGVATALYREAERRFGRMVPSDNPSPDAQAFWQNYRAPDAPNAGPPRPPMFPGGRNR